MADWLFPLRKGSEGYSPRKPEDSFLRTGYPKTSSNPHGYHWAIDLAAPEGTIVQLPVKGKIVYKGWQGALGNVLVIKCREEPQDWYWTMCHLKSYTTKPVGTVLPRGYAVGRVGKTGGLKSKPITGPHLHGELRVRGASFSLRDPRKNPYPYIKKAYDLKRWKVT